VSCVAALPTVPLSLVASIYARLLLALLPITTSAKLMALTAFGKQVYLLAFVAALLLLSLMYFGYTSSCLSLEHADRDSLSNR
jgi:hypothetical protein